MEDPLISDAKDEESSDIEAPANESRRSCEMLENVDDNQEPSDSSTELESGTSNREILLGGAIKRNRLCMKRFWCGCSIATLLGCFLLWFIVVLPVARWIITSRAGSAPVHVKQAFVTIDETHPVIYCDSLEAVVPKAAWDMGFALNWISFTAEVPAVNATMYAHFPNGTVVKSGLFASTTKMTMHSWEDMHANFTGVLYPEMSVMKDLFMIMVTQPVMKMHITTMVSISATLFGWFPMTIPNVPLKSAVISVDGMNNFRNTTVKLLDYVRVNGTHDTLTLVVKTSMDNPTPFGCKLEGDIKMDALWRNGGQLGTLYMSNTTLLPKALGPSIMQARFDYQLPSTQLEKDAFNQFLHEFIGDPKGFEPSGTHPIMVSAGPPKHGFPSTNPMLRKVLTGDFRLNTTMTPIPFTPLQAVNVTVPIFRFWTGATVVFRIYNPLPVTISIDTVVAELYYLNLTGLHLYTFNHTFPPKSKLVHGNAISDISIAATLDGIDTASVVKIIGKLVKTEGDITVGVRGNFTISVEDFQLTIPYTNDGLESKIIWR